MRVPERERFRLGLRPFVVAPFVFVDSTISGVFRSSLGEPMGILDAAITAFAFSFPACIEFLESLFPASSEPLTTSPLVSASNASMSGCSVGCSLYSDCCGRMS